MPAPTKRHVILIAYYFPPSQMIGGYRCYRFYKYLKRIGYACDVVTASKQDSNCPADVSFIEDPLHERWMGSARPKRSFASVFELLARKAAFPGEIGFVWAIRVAALCRDIISRHPKHKFVLVCSYPALGVLLAGLLVRLRQRVAWIADFRDPLAAFVWHHMPGYARLWNHVLERAVFRSAAAVVANTEGAAAVWRNRCPWAQGKLSVIPNGFDPEDAPRTLQAPAREEKTMVHTGALYDGRNPNAVLQALFRLRSRRIPEACAVRVLLLGPVAPNAGIEAELYSQAERDGWLEVRSTVPKQQAWCIMGTAETLLLLQPQTDTQIPGKLFEYICVGRPILAFVHRSSPVTEILTQSGVPFVCIYPDESPETIDEKLAGFLRLPTSPTRYREWFATNFSAERQTKVLSGIIERLK